MSLFRTALCRTLKHLYILKDQETTYLSAKVLWGGLIMGELRPLAFLLFVVFFQIQSPISSEKFLTIRLEIGLGKKTPLGKRNPSQWMGATVQPKFMALEERRGKDKPDSYLRSEGGIQGFVPTYSQEEKLNQKGMVCKCLRSRPQTHLFDLSKVLVKTIFSVSVFQCNKIYVMPSPFDFFILHPLMLTMCSLMGFVVLFQLCRFFAAFTVLHRKNVFLETC